MKKLFLLSLALLASFSLWAAVSYHSISPNIANTDYETFYLYKNSSDEANVIGKAYSSSTLSFSSANSSWVEGNCTGKDNSASPGDFSSQGFYKTDAGDLKFNGTTNVVTFHVTNCIGVAILGKGNGSTKPLQLSVKESGSSSEVGTIAQNASNTVAVTAYGTTLSASKNYDITISSVSGGNSYAYQIRFTAAPSYIAPTITAPTTDQSATYTIGDEITALSITATGTPDPTYQWYYNNSASTEGATSLGAGAQTTSYTPANDVTSDLYYYCVATNTAGSATSPYFHITVNAPSAPSHNITYNAESLKGQSVSGYPTEFYEGIGIASFDALPDVTNFHFNGWNPASIGSDVTTDVELTATWVAAYNVTFNAGDGSGTVPTSFQKWAGATFELPGQGDMVAPSGKVFDGWKANGTGDKLPANTEYTMTASAVEFVAQWKGVPTTIFDWTFASTNNIEADNTDLSNASYGTLTTGTSVVGRLFGTNTIAKNSAGYKLANDDVCIEIQGTSTFQEGDTVKFLARGGGDGERGLSIASSSVTSAANADTARTNLIDDKNNARTYTVIITDKQAGTKIRVFRMAGKTMYLQNIKVIRPAARDTLSKDTLLSDVKVNDRLIHTDSLAMLKTGSAFSLKLKDSYVEAPVIKFNERTIITFEEGAPTIKNKVYTVTSTEVKGVWQAQATIADTTYTITADITPSYTVSYYDGALKLGEEVVVEGKSPVDYETYQAFYGSLGSFGDWYTDDDLEEGHKIADISALVVDEDKAVYGKWTKTCANNIDFEAFIDENGTSGDWEAYLSSNNYVISSNTNVSLDAPENKPADKGLKIKNTGTTVKFIADAGKLVILKVGVLSGAQWSEDAGLNYTNLSGASGSTGESMYTYYYNEVAMQYAFKATTSSYNIIQAITITNPYTITFDANGGDDVASQTGTPSVTLPKPTNSPKYFAGWYDDATDGELIGWNGDDYIPTANITLYAHWSNTPTGIDNTEDEVKAVKYFKDGQIFIEKNGHVYNVFGACVK